MKVAHLSLLALVVLGCAAVAFCEEYEDGQNVPLTVNKVGPYGNPSETYKYYSLPFCRREEAKKLEQGLSHDLKGDHLMSSPYKLPFKKNVESETLCTYVLQDRDFFRFKKAIEKKYFFEHFVDGLPVHGFVGKKVESSDGHFEYYLYTDFNFAIGYNEHHIVEVNLTTDPTKKTHIYPNADVTFTYSVRWVPTEKIHEERMERYTHNYAFSSQNIRWFSITNSLVSMILLTGVVAFILARTLKRDYDRYNLLNDEDELDMAEQEETGWKLLHGDVFRFPEHKNIFASLLGVGTQFVTLTFSMLLLTMVGIIYEYRRGNMYTAVVVLYALTASVAGYVSSSYYKRFGGTGWVRNVLLTLALFGIPLFSIGAFLNVIAAIYKSTVALSIGSLAFVVLIWFLLTFPLTVISAIAGKNYASPFDAPCRTNKVPREIPSVPWYRQSLVLVLLSGFVPFSGIFLELHYVFSSMWGYKLYTLYGVLFVVFCILLVVTAMVSITTTYFILTMEDHRWWWLSFLSGGSTAFYVYLYCFFYFFSRADMQGFLQSSYFFGYMSLTCYALFIMLGAVGFFAALGFVRRIYKAIKVD